MNIFLWVLQILLAFHTVIGAFWKFSNTEQMVPSLKLIPHAGWLALSGLELVCAIALVLPLIRKRLGFLPPLAAIGIAAEMLLFSGLHVASGDENYGPMIYWLVVALVCGFIAVGRLKLRPL